MKFVYGRSDWADGWRGEENCYLLTNGLGGFSSATMIGSSARNDHSFFMACIKAPNHRYSMIHRLEEVLDLGEKKLCLSSQKYTDETRDEEGFRFLDSFCFEDYPRWFFHADGVEIEKEAAMKQGENVIAVRYRIENRTGREVTLRVTPHLQFRPKGEQPHKGQEFAIRRMAGQKAEFVITSDKLELYFSATGTVHSFPARFVTGLYYAYDECDGRNPQGNTYVNHCVEKRAAAGESVSLEIVYRMHPVCGPDKIPRMGNVPNAVRDKIQDAGGNFSFSDREDSEASGIFEDAARYREGLAEVCGLKDETARMLAKSAGQFVAERESSGGKTILAGFPFFEDWGRDTMIAVAGCCISTGQLETARSILRTFAVYCKEGLMPNLFPEGRNEPMYNTADASLLFINAVYLYYEKQARRTSPDGLNFVREMWPTMCGIIDWYKRGTLFGIHMDEDGLLAAGQGLDQVTWMDVRINDILPTPRHGKPVEVNAYWYNALCVMGFFDRLLNRKKDRGNCACKKMEKGMYENAEDEEGKNAGGEKKENLSAGKGAMTKNGAKIREYDFLAQKAGKSFREKFWNKKASCLKDVLTENGRNCRDGIKEDGPDEHGGGGQSSGIRAEEQIRCNQIWAVSMPFCALDGIQQKKVVDTVFEKLYTPYGLRTLAKDDPEFHGKYGGSQLKRDLAYHQGTVWVFPLGAYYLAYLKTEQYSKRALEKVRRQLEPLENALREGCIGQLPEIYDGEFPSFSRGCFAQAWSVGEILRVYEALETYNWNNQNTKYSG